MRRYSQTGLIVLLLATGAAAHARDEELCNSLANLVPLASSKFRDIRGGKVESGVYKARLLLPAASKCELTENDDDAKSVTYGCEFQLNKGRKGEAESLNYADNIMACIPNLKRSQDGRTTFLESERVMFQLTPFSRYISIDLHYRAPD